MELVLATRNKSKQEQIRALLVELPIKVLSLDEAGVWGEAVEDGCSLEENAIKKAAFAWQRGRFALAEDTGLFIDALGGKPGIHAARWAGAGASTEETLRYTLERLKHVPAGKRTAAFRTVAALMVPGGTHAMLFHGEVRGALLDEPRIACQPNMPYSGIFMPDGQSKVWSEMSVEEENAISHRGKAFRQVRDFLRNRIS